jgi:hypothetical protein
VSSSVESGASSLRASGRGCVVGCGEGGSLLLLLPPAAPPVLLLLGCVRLLGHADVARRVAGGLRLGPCPACALMCLPYLGAPQQIRVAQCETQDHQVLDRSDGSATH